MKYMSKKNIFALITVSFLFCQSAFSMQTRGPEIGNYYAQKAIYEANKAAKESSSSSSSGSGNSSSSGSGSSSNSSSSSSTSGSNKSSSGNTGSSNSSSSTTTNGSSTTTNGSSTTTTSKSDTSSSGTSNVKSSNSTSTTNGTTGNSSTTSTVSNSGNNSSASTNTGGTTSTNQKSTGSTSTSGTSASSGSGTNGSSGSSSNSVSVSTAGAGTSTSSGSKSTASSGTSSKSSGSTSSTNTSSSSTSSSTTSYPSSSTSTSTSTSTSSSSSSNYSSESSISNSNGNSSSNSSGTNSNNETSTAISGKSYEILMNFIMEAKRAEEERIAAAAEKAKNEWLAAEAIRKAEQERIAAEAARKAEEERIAAEAARRAEEERLAAEAARRAEEERIAAEAARKAEEERLAAEAARRAEEERIAAEAARKAEEERLAAEAARKAEEARIAAEKRAADAEKSENLATSKYNNIKKDYLASVEKMKNLKEFSTNEQNEIIRDYTKVEAEFKTAESNLKHQSEAMIDAYNYLSDVYEKYEYSGDPVRIATGDYVCEYKDYEAQDFLNKFIITRNLTNENKLESFGYGWTCSLDSRIIRCNYESYDDCIEEIKKCRLLIDEMKHCYDEYKELYPEFNSENTLKCDSDVLLFESNLNNLDEYVSDRTKRRNIISERNKYVTYGKYSKEASYYGYENFLKYLDENGNEYSFYYDSDGIWKSVGVLSSSKMYLSNRDDGGYILQYSDGRKKEYSYYGLLEKEIDSNGNETIYYNKEGRIVKVQLKTGEIISINRNSDGLICSIEGETSGRSAYSYRNNYLENVVDNKNIAVRFSYDDNGFLHKIMKADNSSVQIEYEYNSLLSKYICSSVINNNSRKEYFSWDVQTKTMFHIAQNGRTETNIYNDNGNPIYIEDCYGNKRTFKTNENGLILSYSENGVEKKFYYDEKNRPVRIEYENGSNVVLSYNSMDLVTRITDADGFTKNYEYDSKGNLIASYFGNNLLCSFLYYPNGLLKTKKENNCITEYEYNNFGSVTKEKHILPDGQEIKQNWNYDSQNRITKWIDAAGYVTVFDYEENKRIETYNNRKKIECIFDKKNREVEYITSDLESGKSYKRQIVYDSNGNIEKVYYDGTLYEENEYSIDDKVIKSTIWDLVSLDACKSMGIERTGVTSEYSYTMRGLPAKDKKNIISEANLEKGEKYLVSDREYKFIGGECIVSEKNIFGDTSVYTYNPAGKLIKKVYSDDSYELYTYTLAGRLKSVKDDKNNMYSYTYFSDGSYSVTLQSPHGSNLSYDYDSRGKLLRCKNALGYKYEYSYDYAGRLLTEAGPGYRKKYSYDTFGRITSYIIEDTGNQFAEYNLCSEKNIYYNDSTGVVSIMSNGVCIELLHLDAWGRPIEITDRNGKQWYEYDVMNNVTSERDSEGNITRYYYDGYGNLILKKINDSIVLNIEHDAIGNIIKVSKNKKNVYENNYNFESLTCSIINSYGDKTEVVFNTNGMINYENNSRFGEEFYNWSEKNRLTVNRNNNEYEYVFDEYGNIILENNYSGNQAKYSYDKLGRVIQKIDFNGIRNDYIYDDNKNLISITYGTGEKSVIQRNALGLVVSAKNDFSNFLYEYDLLGNLTSLEDLNSMIKIEYSYDSYGRCIEKKSSMFDFIYEYDEKGKLKTIKDNKSGVWISFYYDKSGQEIVREFSNGNLLYITYDANENLESYVYKNSMNEVLEGNFLIRDETGRISVISDVHGNWKKIEYTKNGQVSKFIYPYSDEINEFYYLDVLETGGYVKNKLSNGTTVFLNAEEITGLEKVLANAGVTFSVAINASQNSWIENVVYNENGSVNYTKNLYGTIYYDYDSMNRLISKYGGNSKEEGMHFNWDKNGNLISYESFTSSVRLIYGAYNRPTKITLYDKNLDKEEYITFAYDSFGRRISQNINEDEAYFFVYDGFSLDVIETTPVLQNRTAVSKYLESLLVNNDDYSLQEYKLVDSDKYNSIDNYRTITGKGYSDYGSTKGYFEESLLPGIFSNKSSDYDKSAFSTICVNSLPVVNVRIDGNSDLEKEFLFTDISGCLSSVYNESGNSIADNSYDFWGNKIAGNGNPAFSYSRNKIYLPLNLYNLGYRDYCPQLKSFITQDPKRDGSNWYAFCSGDPVNYSDPDGCRIIPVELQFLMTDYSDDIKLGNSQVDKVNKEGCYITTLANVAKTLQKYGVNNVDFDDPLKINEHKELFGDTGETAGCIYRKASMDSICGDTSYDYWTKAGSTTYTIEAQLAKAAAVQNNCIVIAVFDLSSEEKSVSNHMVVLNNNFNNEGYLEMKEDITGSSANDYRRIQEGKLSAYNLSNVKELRVIETETKECNK